MKSLLSVSLLECMYSAAQDESLYVEDCASINNSRKFLLL
jgi:hypothetical protein